MDVGFNDPFEGDLPEGSRSIEDLEEQAATQEALADEREEALSAAAEEDKPVEERTVPWSQNTAWDGDTSLCAGLYGIGRLIGNAQPVIIGFGQLIEFGELAEEVQRREVELSISERVLIYTALQVLGIVSGEQWRVPMDAILSKLEALIEPSEIEEEAIRAAEVLASEEWAKHLKELLGEDHPDARVYTQDEFEEEMANADTDDPHIKRLQAEQQADLN